MFVFILHFTQYFLVL